jgi:hypothetical protein
MLIRFLIPTAVAVIALFQSAFADAPGNLNGKTVGDMLSILNDKAEIIDATGDSSAKIQDIALAQDQYLLHDIVERTAEELKYIFRANLKKTIDSFDMSKQNSMIDFLREISDLQYDDDARTLDGIHKLYPLANRIFADALGDSPRPIVYGMRVGDLVNSGEKPPADLEIFGFDLVSSSVNKNPTVSVDASDVPSNMVSVKDGRVFVEIPQDIKARIHFGELPCVLRYTFNVLLSAYTTEPRGFWPIKWTVPAVKNFELHALPSARIYELDISYDFEKSNSSVRTETFSRKSPQALAECGQTASTSVEIDAPAGAQDISCAASWVETSGVKRASQRCQIKDKSVEADGAITGLDKFCSTPSLCACSEYARGWLQIDGSYKVREDKTENFIDAKIGKYRLPAESDVSFPVNLESGAKLNHIGILTRQASCSSVYDRLDLFFPEGVVDVVKGASKNGVFRATYSHGQMVVRHSTSESTVGDAGAD